MRQRLDQDALHHISQQFQGTDGFQITLAGDEAGSAGVQQRWAFRHLPVARIHQGIIKHAPLRLPLPLSILVLVQKFPEHMGPKSGAMSMTGTGSSITTSSPEFHRFG